MPIMLFIIMIFILWLHYEKSKSTNIDKKNTEAFWKAEQDANQTRKLDISNLEYISIPIELLPFQDTTDEILKNLQQDILHCSTLKIVNLTGFSNTDLKLKYGAPNLTILSEYDQNYTFLVRALNSWGSYLFEQNQKEEAKTVLDFAISCNTDIKQTYILLAQIYMEEQQSQLIYKLIEKSEALNSLSKDIIKKSLTNLLDQSAVS